MKHPLILKSSLHPLLFKGKFTLDAVLELIFNSIYGGFLLIQFNCVGVDVRHVRCYVQISLFVYLFDSDLNLVFELQKRLYDELHFRLQLFNLVSQQFASLLYLFTSWVLEQTFRTARFGFAG